MKALVFLLLFLLTTIPSISQYKPFIEPAKTWRELVEHESGEWYLDDYQFTNDTVINTEIYKKLEIINSTDSTIALPYFRAAIREGTASKMVYVRYPQDSIERVLYNFNLQQGDPHVFHHCFYLSPVPSNPHTAIVDSISTYTDEYGDDRKVWYLDMSHNGVTTRIVEGVGSNSGLITYSCHFDAWIDLICVHDDSATFFINDLPYANYCTPFVAVNISVFSDKNKIEIYPNPTTADFRIRTTGKTVDYLKIYDSSGKLIKEYTTYSDNQLVHTKLKTGVYIVETSIDGKIFRNRLIISR